MAKGGHQDRAQVIDDGQGSQENLERSRHMASEQSQHAQRKRDVGRHRNPHAALGRRTGIQGKVQQGRNADPSNGRNDGQQCVAEVGKLSVVQFTLEFQAHHQEEHCHQAIVDPVLDAHSGKVPMPEREIASACGRVCHQQRQQGAGDEDDAARFFGSKKTREAMGEGAGGCGRSGIHSGSRNARGGPNNAKRHTADHKRRSRPGPHPPPATAPGASPC